MAKAVEVITTYEDHTGKESTSTAYVNNGMTLAQYTEGLRGMASIIDGITSAVIKGVTFCISIGLGGLTGNIGVGLADIEEVGAFQFRTADNRPVDVNVPAITDTLSGTGTDDLDQLDANVSAFISAMEDGIAVTGGTIVPCDVDEDDIVSTKYAREETRSTGTRS